MGKVKISTDKYDEIIELYKNGYSQKKIADLYDVSGNAIFKILKKCNASELGTARDARRVFLTELDEYEICNMYLSGISSVKLGKKFNCSCQTIIRVLERHNIKRTHISMRQYQLDEHYFDDIDTPNKAYYLGLLYADGFNNERTNTIIISLQKGDENVLELMRRDMCSEIPLKLIDHSDRRACGQNWKDQYRLEVHSKHMSKTLKQYGVVQNKSLILEWPTFLRDYLYPHFLRGYIDGDGCIKTQKYTYEVNFAGTYNFCKKAQDYILEKFNIECTLYKDACKNGITSVLYIYGKKSVKHFLDSIYKDSDVYLERKYNTYISKYCSEESIDNTLIA